MGQLNKIILNRYRNFKSKEFSFLPRCNIFFGMNGTGKTNLLEAISIHGKGRGFRNSTIKDIVLNNESDFHISSEYEKDKITFNLDIYSKLIEGKYKKITAVNDETSKQSLELLDSSLSFLYFLPEMERLFLTSPSYRRNFVDKLIFSEIKDYNKIINKYKKKILERNKILQSGNLDEDWINILENEISILGIKIYNIRSNQFIQLNHNIELINKKNDYPFSVKFEMKDNFFNSNLDQKKYLENLKNNRGFDTKFGGSKIGPHKSDYITIINDNFNAANLSTGQQKTIVLMSIIAQCNHLINNKNIKPIMIFDEICSHLDRTNRKILLELVNEFDIQFFLTGTEKSLFSFMSTNVNFYNIT